MSALVHQAPSETAIKYFTMTVGPHQFGIPVARIQEILRDLNTTPVPRAPEVVRGLINLRGEIVTAIFLSTRLGLTQDEGDGRTHIVLRTSDGVFSRIVDTVGDVVQIGVADAAQGTASGAAETQRAANEMSRLAAELQGAVTTYEDTRRRPEESMPSFTAPSDASAFEWADADLVG